MWNKRWKRCWILGGFYSFEINWSWTNGRESGWSVTAWSLNHWLLYKNGQSESSRTYWASPPITVAPIRGCIEVTLAGRQWIWIQFWPYFLRADWGIIQSAERFQTPVISKSDRLPLAAPAKKKRALSKGPSLDRWSYIRRSGALMWGLGNGKREYLFICWKLLEA